MDVLLPVVAKNQSERAQGVFRTVTVNAGLDDPWAYILPLGYLVSIWQKLNHMSFPREFDTVYGATGQGHYDCAQKFENWQIAYVEIEVVSYPEGADMVFGENPLIYAGRGAFFVSSASHRGQEWDLITPLKTTQTLQLIGGLNIAPPGEFLMPPPAGDGVTKTGTFGESRGINATNFRYIEQPSIFIGGAVTFGGGAPPKKPQTFIKGGIENATYAYFPLQYINYQRTTYDAPSPRANGFWWQLKPGVVANISIFGTLVEPGVEAGPTESGNAKFNPMKGEELP